MPGRRRGAPSVTLEPLPDLVGRSRPLGEQVRAHARLRWVTVVAIVLGALAGHDVLGFSDLPLGGFFALAAGIAGYNLLLFALLRDDDPRRVLVLRHLSVGLDFVALTAGLWLAGGAGSPFAGLYVIHVVLSSMLLERREALAHTALGIALYAGLAFGLWTGRLPAVGPHELTIPVAGMPVSVPLALVTAISVLMLAAMLLVRPVIERLRANERRLEAINAELRDLARLRRDFLHVTIHDLKAPIAAVRSILTAVRSGHAGPVGPDLAAWIDRCLDRLAGLSAFLRELALLAELDDRALRERSVPVDLEPLVREVVDEHADIARPRAVRLEVEADGNVPAVRGQPRLLREAVANYLTNAIRHSPEGGTVTVRVRAVGDGVRIEVEDRGPGIPVDEQPRLFQEFARISTRRAGEGGGRPPGAGLGLSIVRRIVTLHGGRVGVDSAPGRGSRFWFDLPAEGTPTPVSRAGP